MQISYLHINMNMYIYICIHIHGQYAKAIEQFEQARIIAKEEANRVDQGKACLNLGNCYESLGQYDTAIDVLEVARAIAEEVHDLADKGVYKLCCVRVCVAVSAKNA